MAMHGAKLNFIDVFSLAHICMLHVQHTILNEPEAKLSNCQIGRKEILCLVMNKVHTMTISQDDEQKRYILVGTSLHLQNKISSNR